MMEVTEVSRTKFDPYVIGNNIRDLREKRKMTQMNANYAQTECQFRYCGTAIPFLTVRSTAR